MRHCGRLAGRIKSTKDWIREHQSHNEGRAIFEKEKFKHPTERMWWLICPCGARQLTMEDKIVAQRIKTVEQSAIGRTTCQHGIEMAIAEKGACAICTTLSKNLERDNSIYKKPSPVLMTLRNKHRESRKEATRILLDLGEICGFSIKSGATWDWDEITYYDLKHVGAGFKEIEFLMEVKQRVAAREWYEPSRSEIFRLRDINTKIQGQGEDDEDKKEDETGDGNADDE